MTDIHDDRLAVYEIGYLIQSSVAEEHVPAEAEKIRKIVTDAGATVMADEMPHKERLAYTMRRKTVSGSYMKYDEAYFGWVKFEVGSDKIEGIKSSVSLVPTVLRMLVTSTVRENTYLGKRAADVVAGLNFRRTPVEGSSAVSVVEKKNVVPASIEEMDKSIDEMVKEV